MQVEAKWENGALHPLRPLMLKHARVTIIVPDEEIETSEQMLMPPELETATQELLKQFEAIRNAPMPVESELPAWTEKNQERLEAFELRRQLRQEQGRAF